MDIEEIGSFEIIRCKLSEYWLASYQIAVCCAEKGSYLAKMHFIKDHLVGVADADKSRDEGENGDYSEDDFIVELIASRFALAGLCELVELLFYGSRTEVFLARDVSLAQAVLGSRA